MKTATQKNLWRGRDPLLSCRRGEGVWVNRTTANKQQHNKPSNTSSHTKKVMYIELSTCDSTKEQHGEKNRKKSKTYRQVKPSSSKKTRLRANKLFIYLASLLIILFSLSPLCLLLLKRSVWRFQMDATLLCPTLVISHWGYYNWDRGKLRQQQRKEKWE